MFVFTTVLSVVVHWNQRNSKSLQVSRNLLSIFSIFKMLWSEWSWFFLLFPISLISSQSAPTTIGIAINLIFHSFFVPWQDSSICVSFHFLFIYTVVHRDSKSTRWWDLFFVCANNMFGFLAGMWWSVCNSKSQRILCVSYSETNFSWCILVGGLFGRMFKFRTLAWFQWIIAIVQSYTISVLACSICLSFTVSSFSSNLWLLFCYVL